MSAAEATLFPPSPRVFYEKAPLLEVVCQLRFPPLLAIQSQPPAAFQEHIRGSFPLMEETVDTSRLANLPAEIQKILSGQPLGNAYKFSSEDSKDTVTLSRESLAYSTQKYTRWEKFTEIFRSVLISFTDIYKPSFYTRIGLRYIDAINRKALSLDDEKWSTLFRQEILGELSVPVVEDNLEASGRQIRMRLPNELGHIFLQHGLATVLEKEGLSYTIDFDFYREQKTEVQDAERTLDSFHDLAGRAFRWCITEKLHHALGPKPLGDV